jgi:hypothetical protein
MILCYLHVHEHTLPSFQLPYRVSSNHMFFVLSIVLFFHFSKSVIMTKHFLKVQGLARGHVRKRPKVMGLLKFKLSTLNMPCFLLMVHVLRGKRA